MLLMTYHYRNFRVKYDRNKEAALDFSHLNGDEVSGKSESVYTRTRLSVMSTNQNEESV